MNEVKNEEKGINEQIFTEYFNCQSPSFLSKDLCEDNENKNNIAKNLNESFIHLRNSVNSKKIPENQNPEKVLSIVEKILGFNKQQKGKGRPLDLDKCINILTAKQMLQRLPIALNEKKKTQTKINYSKSI